LASWSDRWQNDGLVQSYCRLSSVFTLAAILRLILFLLLFCLFRRKKVSSFALTVPPFVPPPLHPLNLICASPIPWPLSYVTLAYTGSFERAQQFGCLGTTLRSQNTFRGEIKSRLTSGIVCCHSMQSLLSYSFISKNIKIKIHRNIILPVV
jgi:hypothetical protein